MNGITHKYTQYLLSHRPKNELINLGDWNIKILKDGWTAVIKDKSLSAQFEHTVGITTNGNEIFTLSKNNSDLPINII